MFEINLLPWRTIRKNQNKKKFLIITILILIVIGCVLLLINNYMNQLIDNRLSYNHRLKKEISIYDNKINRIKQLKKDKEKLISNIYFIKYLQKSCFFSAYLLKKIAKMLPSDIYLKKIQKINNKIIIFGFSKSTNSISLLMHKIENNKWIKLAAVDEIKKNNLKGVNGFKLSFTVCEKIFLLEELVFK